MGPTLRAIARLWFALGAKLGVSHGVEICDFGFMKLQDESANAKFRLIH
jgi:hypothetical protein